MISHPHPTSSTSISGFVSNDDDNNNNAYLNPNPISNPNPNPDNSSSANKRKRSLPGHPDPEAEVVALSPRSLMATNRFICEVCNKGFQREQNLQLHRRGHNLPWKLKQKAKEAVRRKVYICPEKSCVHHDASRALGDLTGIKKHFSRKHGEKKWKCDKCAKKYAVMSDWKAHAKICGTREYKCDCGTIFSRKDSFITHRAFCDALTEERMRVTNIGAAATMNPNFRVDMSFISSTPQSITGISPFSTSHGPEFMSFESSSAANNNNNKPRLPLWLDHQMELQGNGSSPFLGSSSGGRAGHVLPEFPTSNFNLFSPHSVGGGILKNEEDHDNGKSSYPQGLFSLYSSQPQHQPLSSGTTGCSMSATALLQKAAQIGSTRSENNSTAFANASLSSSTPMLSSSHVPGGGFRQEAAAHGGGGFSGQLMMMGPSSGGMRDFLGTLGGSTSTSRVDVSNDDSGARGGENERRVALQEEMAYKLATMAAGAHQEPYMDLMR